MGWLEEAFKAPTPVVVEALTGRLIGAGLLGCIIALLYYLTLRRGAASSSFISTLVLLTILIAMVTQIIGDSVARAFSLVGTLSIVRFRTVVEDTRDTAFVILAVVVGMALGMGYLIEGCIGLSLVSIATIALRYTPGLDGSPQEDWTLHVRIGAGFGDPPPWEDTFSRHLLDARLTSTSSARQGAAFDLSYKVRLKPETTPLAFLKDLTRLEGVQNLELKQAGN